MAWWVMNRTSLPYGGLEIENLRRAHKRPADMVLVSLVGLLRQEANPLIVASPKRDYEWGFLTGLEVLLIANSQLETSIVRRFLKAISNVKPAYLGLWIADKQDGQNVAWGSYKPKSKAIRQMTRSDRIEFAGVGA